MRTSIDGVERYLQSVSLSCTFPLGPELRVGDFGSFSVLSLLFPLASRSASILSALLEASAAKDSNPEFA